MAVVRTKEGYQINSPTKEFTANEGDIFPDNTNNLQGWIQNGSCMNLIMDNNSLKVLMFNEKNNVWFEI